MKILIVEDDQQRIDWFEREFKDADVVVVKEAEDGIREVEATKYDVIFLDHDLGGRAFVESHDPNTGFQVALAIVKSPNKNTPIVIHSWNPAGAGNMQSILKHAIYAPFSTFTKDILAYLLR